MRRAETWGDVCGEFWAANQPENETNHVAAKTEWFCTRVERTPSMFFSDRYVFHVLFHCCGVIRHGGLMKNVLHVPTKRSPQRQAPIYRTCSFRLNPMPLSKAVLAVSSRVAL